MSVDRAGFNEFYREHPDFPFLEKLLKKTDLKEFESKTGYSRSEGKTHRRGLEKDIEFALNTEGGIVARSTVWADPDNGVIADANIVLIQGEHLISHRIVYKSEDDELPTDWDITARPKQDMDQSTSGHFVVSYRSRRMDPMGAFVGFGDAPATLDEDKKRRYGIGFMFAAGLEAKVFERSASNPNELIARLKNRGVFNAEYPKCLIRPVITDSVVELSRIRNGTTTIFTSPRYAPMSGIHEMVQGSWEDFVQTGTRFPVSVREPRVAN